VLINLQFFKHSLCEMHKMNKIMRRLCLSISPSNWKFHLCNYLMGFDDMMIFGIG
jgi:hypothetical protein